MPARHRFARRSPNWGPRIVAERRVPSKRATRKTAVEQADIAIVDKLEPMLDHPAVEKIAKVGKVADEPPLLLVSGMLLAIGLLSKNPKLTRSAGTMMLAHGLAIAIKNLGKNNIDRTRPSSTKNGKRYRMEPGSSSSKDLRSFPSGHAAGAMALARAFGRHFPQYKNAAYATAGVLGAMQVARRAHFPSDVAAGLLVGAVAEDIGSRFLRGMQRRLSDLLPA